MKHQQQQPAPQIPLPPAPISPEAVRDCLQAINQDVDGLKKAVNALNQTVTDSVTAAKESAQKAESAAVSAKALAAKPAEGLRETLERIDALENKLSKLDELNTWAETAEANICALQEATGCYCPKEKLTTRIRRRIANWFSPDEQPQPDKQPAKAKRCRRTK